MLIPLLDTIRLRAGELFLNVKIMDFSFAAERKVVLTVQAGGRNRLVEFGERNLNGVSCYLTTDAIIANSIRRHSLSRRGVIVETTPPQQQEPLPEPKRVAKTDTQPKAADGTPIRTFDNFSVAKETITKELGIPRNKVRTPATLEKLARENGFTIKYNNA